MKKSSAAVVLCCLLLLSSSVMASGVVIHGAWSPAVPAGSTSIPVFLVLTQTGPQSERLVGASSALASNVSMHAMQVDDGEFSAARVAGIHLPAGVPVSLDLGTAWLLLEGVQQNLRPGSHYTMTLRFAGAPDQDVRVRVRSTHYYGGTRMDDLRSDPLEQPRPSRRSEGLDDVRTDPLIR